MCIFRIFFLSLCLCVSLLLVLRLNSNDNGSGDPAVLQQNKKRFDGSAFSFHFTIALIRMQDKFFMPKQGRHMAAPVQDCATTAVVSTHTACNWHDARDSTEDAMDGPGAGDSFLMSR